MKKNLHPEQNNLKATCACGASYDIKSVKAEMQLDLCSACHPFFTGTQKFVDRAGRIEKFQRRLDARK